MESTQKENIERLKTEIDNLKTGNILFMCKAKNFTKENEELISKLFSLTLTLPRGGGGGEGALHNVTLIIYT